MLRVQHTGQQPSLQMRSKIKIVFLFLLVLSMQILNMEFCYNTTLQDPREKISV